MNTDTIAAIATGMTPSGIGIIRISGEDAFSIASSLFHKKNGKPLTEYENKRAYYGYVHDNDTVLDEVILLIFVKPFSYTGENTVEIQCHGGILMMKKILELCIRFGARPAQPGEFTKRAFLNGKIDLSEAEAVMDVISSQNDLALKNSVKQLRGSLYKKITGIREDILYETAFIESAVDDPEHFDLTGYPEKLSVKLLGILRELEKLSDSFDDGRILSEGVRTVILGKPNVGKSSLLNILVGSERAIVTEIAGTTRDAIEEKININGVLLHVIDTAGIRQSEDIVEQIGVKKAMEIAEDADLVIMVMDSSETISSEDEEILSFIKKNNRKCIILLNKSDLGSIIGPEEIACYTNNPVIMISAKDETGIDELKEYIVNEYSKGYLKYNDEIFISNARQKDALNNAIGSLLCVAKSITENMPEDFYSIDLTAAYESLGLIIGQQVDDDVIEEIFSKFCMGK
ncbi:MAG: tRNA uridine-5-carboxymethylaminomethyl(34) synthesis GTPase MnmE [Lachnospiraceae bacterium]|nr:tRNA uridine-5-carboxymethylaminomethyl(34) synthesis GTPase MnmE [Lachnospiraceae bacterium]